jgi:hypothetical protein
MQKMARSPACSPHVSISPYRNNAYDGRHRQIRCPPRKKALKFFIEGGIAKYETEGEGSRKSGSPVFGDLSMCRRAYQRIAELERHFFVISRSIKSELSPGETAKAGKPPPQGPISLWPRVLRRVNGTGKGTCEAPKPVQEPLGLHLIFRHPDCGFRNAARYLVLKKIAFPVAGCVLSG